MLLAVTLFEMVEAETAADDEGIVVVWNVERMDIGCFPSRTCL
jgi:hypothetical protein